MADLMMLPVILGLCLFGGCIIGCMLISETIVRLEYERHRADWEKDKQPYGYGWMPPGSSAGQFPFFEYWGHSMARGRLLGSLCFSTPHWVREDADVYRAVRRYRFLLLVGIVAFVLSAGLLVGYFAL